MCYPVHMSNTPPANGDQRVYMAICDTDNDPGGYLIEFANAAAAEAFERKVNDLVGGQDQPWGFRAEVGKFRAILSPAAALDFLPADNLAQGCGHERSIEDAIIGDVLGRILLRECRICGENYAEHARPAPRPTIVEEEQV
jgi:hypothetical protein